MEATRAAKLRLAAYVDGDPRMKSNYTVGERFKYAWAVSCTNYLTSNQRYSDALNKLARIYPDSLGNVCVEKLSIICAIRCSFLSLKLGLLALAAEALTVALNKLDIGLWQSGKRISVADREYLYFYCRWLACLFPPDSPTFNLALTTGGSLQALDLPNTSSLLKRSFAIPKSAGQQVDAFIEGHMPTSLSTPD
jgi:hypothetical protein